MKKEKKREFLGFMKTIIRIVGRNVNKSISFAVSVAFLLLYVLDCFGRDSYFS